MPYRILLRRDLSQNWNYNDPVLMSGEPGYEMDNRKFKMGDGQTPWSQLPYYCGVTGPTGPTGRVLPYKVFTALLTQSGTSSWDDQTSGTFTIGVSYNIDIYVAGDDFSNIGGPPASVNGAWDGYWFIATGTTPSNYSNGSYVQWNTGAPVVTVLENTIGNVWFTYDSIGYYLVNSNGLFTAHKSWTPTIQIFNDTAGIRDGEICEIRQGNSNQYAIATFDQTGAGVDYKLNNTPIEIRVYN